tara:strand:+ start:11883 stop:12218 length:336 start_codon:yes stop_codon:yes gene_type:complete
MKVGLLDLETVPHAPTSKFLTKEEMQKIDSEWIWNRQSFIFKHNIPLMVERKMADVLVKKYESVKYHDKKEDLSKMAYNDLKKLAKAKGMSHKDTFVKKELLIQAIEKLDG